MTHGEAAAHEGDERPTDRVAMTAFQKLSEAWQLSTDQQLQLLGSPGRSTFFKWKKDGGSLPRDTVERVSHLLAIYKALQILVPDPPQADSWIKKKSSYFKGNSALDVMLNGQVVDILKVRQYLDVQRGG
ncbi:antitoxin Xre-like helix-turn-helix domain-containing protein [Methylobacterium planeticum]|nr:antitoxin Xre-like helix-turn-helix domain-containing protein [Methylobacterium planeticum]